ncbi:MAG: transporter substrate-binding domain-containing protein [Desulfobacteraceae bacterium]|nr:transporter substrate-binding domain-containing protein [Desulfobacteraceae bacterium]
MGKIRVPSLLIITKMIIIFLVCIAASSFSDAAPEERSTPLIRHSLTDRETAWLDRHAVITLAIDEGDPPMNYRNGQGKLAGISIDYMELIEEKLGIEIRFEGSTWNEALQKALNHEVDGIVNAASKENRKPFLNFSTTYSKTPLALVTRKNTPPLTNLSQLSGKRVVIIKGSIRDEIIKKYAPESELVEVSNLLEGLKLVSEKKAYAMLDDLPVVQYMIETYFFSNLQVGLIYYHRVAGVSKIGLRNDSPELLSVFNRAINAITPEEHRKIKRKWLNVNDRVHVQRESPFTETEKRWLKDHPVIRVACDPDWAPIEYADQERKFHGISMNYLNYLEKTLGIHFELTGNLSWVEKVKKVKARELDMFSAISRTAERSRFLEFTEPYLSTPVVIFTRQEITYIRNLDELNGQKAGVVEGYAVQEWLSTHNPAIKLVPAENVKKAMNLLQKGDIDFFVSDLVTGSYYITKLGYTSIKVAGETPYRNHLSLAVRKDWPVFAGIIQKLLNDMPENERNDIYRNWISVKYEHGFNYMLLLKFLAGFLVIVLLFVYWNRRLTHEIKERKQVEKTLIQEKSKLQEALLEVKVLSGLLPICASCKNVRDDKGYWNQIETYIERHTQALFSHGLCPTCQEKLYGDEKWYKKMKKKQTGQE